MRGLVVRSPRWLASFHGGRRVWDAYKLLITKKPVEFDYVAVDVNSFVGAASRLSKTLSPDRRVKEVGRHVLNAILQLLRRVLCRDSLLIAFDGPGTFANVFHMRNGASSKRHDALLARLPGAPLMRAVEERVVRAMPLNRGLVPAEVAISGANVEGAVEQKVTAWALDLACRDGAHHTSKSLCLIGAPELLMNMLALTPFFQVTCVLHGASDLRHLTLNDALEWLDVGDVLQTGDARAIAAARTDALLLYLICHGCSATELDAVAGTNFVVVMSEYNTLRRAAAQAPEAPAFQLVRELPDGRLEVDMRVLLLCVGVRERADLPVEAPPRTAAGTAASNASLNHMTLSSHLGHLLCTHHLFCQGVALNRFQVPVYMEAELATRGDNRGRVVTIVEWVRYLSMCVRRGSGYAYASDTGDGVCLSTDRWSQRDGAESAAAAVVPAEAPVSAGRDARREYYPFWSPQQPLTSAEYAILCAGRGDLVAALLREYVPGVTGALSAEVPPALTVTQTNLVALHKALQVFLAHASAVRPHPALCLAPSYHWRQDERSKLWSMRYVDLGVVAAQQGIRYARGLIAGVNMEQQESTDAACAFDAAKQAWTLQPRGFPALTASGQSYSADGIGTSNDGDGAAPTLRVLTWNVMFDRYSNQPTPLGMPGIDWCTTQRYPVLARLIDAEDADVVGLQEVERPFAEFLAAQPWCRERYIMSCSPQSTILEPWGVLLLVRRGGRWPLRQLTHLNVPAWSGHVSLMPVATVDVAHTSAHLPTSTSKRATDAVPREVSICSVHLLAPFVKQNEVARTGQDQALRTALTRQLHGDTLVMGDFNDWPSNEFVMPAETRYVECWPIVHPDDYGKTMDESNTFCKLKIEEIFFGRSDKVFLRTGTGDAHKGGTLRPVEAHLVGTRSVNTENGNTAAPAYLFPSDHYGVSMQFEIQ